MQILPDFQGRANVGRVRNPATDAMKDVSRFLAERHFSRYADLMVKIMADGIYEASTIPDCVL